MRAASRHPETPLVDRTILFSDVVGSTEEIQRHGVDTWRELLWHNERTTSVIAHRHGGRVGPFTGDGFMVTFDRPADGVVCAQRLVAAFSVQNEFGVRFGIARGQVEQWEPDNYIGLAVNIAARCCEAANRFQVLVEADCYRAARTVAALPELDVEHSRFRGLREEVGTCRLVPDLLRHVA